MLHPPPPCVLQARRSVTFMTTCISADMDNRGGKRRRTGMEKNRNGGGENERKGTEESKVERN